jgi:hypothetical protein
MMRTAWPLIKGADDILEWAVSDYAEKGAQYELFAYLGSTPAPDIHDPTLLERLAFYFEQPNLEYLTRYLDQVTGKTSRAWTLSDFEIRPRRRGAREEPNEGPDLGRQHLADLSNEFLGHVHRKEGVSYTRGELARVSLVEYLVQRQEGELEPRGDSFAFPRHQPRKPAHVLCPDRGTLDRYLASLVEFLSGRQHQAAALFELVPAWLRFLESRQLLTREQRLHTLQELRPLHGDLRPLYKGYEHTDPTLFRRFEAWDKEAEKEPVP